MFGWKRNNNNPFCHHPCFLELNLLFFMCIYRQNNVEVNSERSFKRSTQHYPHYWWSCATAVTHDWNDRSRRNWRNFRLRSLGRELVLVRNLAVAPKSLRRLNCSPRWVQRVIEKQRLLLRALIRVIYSNSISIYELTDFQYFRWWAAGVRLGWFHQAICRKTFKPLEKVAAKRDVKKGAIKSIVI